MTLFDTRFDIHLKVADLPEAKSDLLRLEDSLIDYDDIDWQDEIDRRTCGWPPLFNTHTKPLCDEVPF